MRMRWALGSVAVLFVVLAALSGCSKKDEAPKATEPAPTESSVPAPKPPAPKLNVQPMESPTFTPVVVSAALEPFLERKVRMRNVTADQEIRAFFASWEDILKHRSRQPVDIHFDVAVDGPFGKDHAWRSATNRSILDELCQEYDLTWTATEPNTIRVSKKPQ